MLQLFLVVGVVLVIGVGLFIASALFKPGKGKSDGSSGESAPDVALPYVASPLMTRGEIDFYKTLRVAIGDAGVVLAQVPLGSVISIRPKTPNWQRWRNKIDRKTVDYVVCHPVTFATMAVIELDDHTHQQDHRRERDDFVERALAAARVRIVRIPAQRAWSPMELRSRVIVE